MDHAAGLVASAGPGPRGAGGGARAPPPLPPPPRPVSSWLSQAALVLQDADVRFYRRFLRSLVRQVRYLRHTAHHATSGVARMQASIALTYAALCIAGQARHIK